ncbi:MAG: SDR family oxidoreductase, partial [Chloroflexota bacterium]
ILQGLHIGAYAIVGAGSVSFEMVRYLTERLPFMIAPKWLYTRTQPIAVDDVLAYLVGALDKPESHNQIVEIGGKDAMPYIDMLMRYADAVHLKRLVIPVPLLAPTLSSYWVHLVTPISWDIAQPLIQSLEHEVVVKDDSAQRLFPEIKPLGYDESVQRALKETDAKKVETTWLDSTADIWESDEPYTFVEKRGMDIEQRTTEVDATPEVIFDKLNTIGGQNGWFVLNQLWHIRGLADRLMGGVGNRRIRRDAMHLRVGDTLDFWRVENIQPAKMILLRAEMKLPGEGWLRFDLEPQENGKTQLKQTAYFAPRGFAGWVYWTMLFVFHKVIFDGMIAQIKALAEQDDNAPKPVVQSRHIAPIAIGATVAIAVGAIVTVLIRPKHQSRIG